MKTNFENWVSYRYLTGKKGGFLSFLHVVSIGGVAIGVMALIVVTGIMTGFGNNLREKIIGTAPHAVIEKETGIQNYQEFLSDIEGVDGIVGISPYIQGNIFIEDNGHAVSQVIRGIDPKTEAQVTKIKDYLVKGKLTDLTPDSIFIGQELARFLGYGLGDEITLIAPGSGIAGRGWRYTLKIAGIFNTGMVDFDTNLSIVSLEKAKEIFDLPVNTVTGLGIKMQDPYAAKEIKQKLYETLGYSFIVKTWIDANRHLFEALFLEKWGLFLVLTLMILVASFNIVSTLIVTVTSKIHDIGILKSFGVSKRSIRGIFTRQGLFIGTIGTFWGVVLGLAVSFILRNYIEVPAAIYSIDHVPVEVQFSDLILIVVCAIVISYLAAIYPAFRAANLKPVDALRYE